MLLVLSCVGPRGNLKELGSVRAGARGAPAVASSARSASVIYSRSGGDGYGYGGSRYGYRAAYAAGAYAAGAHTGYAYGRRLLSLVGAGRFPMVVGNDFAGTVTALGDNVDAFKIGDRAYGVNTRCDAEEKRTHRLH